MSELLSIHDIERRFPGRRTPLDVLRGRPAPELVAVSGVSLQIDPGKVLGIVGESGCGKSTLARLTVGLQKPDGGSVRLMGEEMRGPDPAGRIQMVFQDAFSSLNPRLSIEALLSETLWRYRPELNAQARKAEVLAVLGRVGLPPETAGRYPHHLSGGQRQRQRVSIARALSPRPRPPSRHVVRPVPSLAGTPRLPPRRSPAVRRHIRRAAPRQAVRPGCGGQTSVTAAKSAPCPQHHMSRRLGSGRARASRSSEPSRSAPVLWHRCGRTASAGPGCGAEPASCG